MPFARPRKREPVGEAGLFDYAVSALGRRMRTERELRRLMAERAVPGTEGDRDMDAVVRRLIEARYLSDERFAETFTRIRKDGRGLGARRVSQELGVKGIGKEMAQQAVAAAYGEADEVALARAYCERKRIKPPEDGPDRAKQAARIMGRLLRAGYSSGAVGKLLRSMRIEVGEMAEISDSEPDHEADHGAAEPPDHTDE